MGRSKEQNIHKDRESRSREKVYQMEVGLLLLVILSEIEFQTINWEGKMKFEKRTELVKKAKGRLQNLQGLLKLFVSLIQPIITEIKSSGRDIGPAESTLKKLVSFFEQKSIEGDLQSTANTLQDGKQELQSYREDLNELWAMGEQREQSLEVQKCYTHVASILEKVANSCVEDFIKQDSINQIQGHCGVERKGKELTISFPKTPGSIQINEKGKNAELHNQEMIVQEKQGNEVFITLHLVEGRLADFKLTGTTNQEMKDLPTGNCDSYGTESFWKGLGNLAGSNLDEGTRIAAANEATVEPSPDETSIFQGYNVSKCYVDVLNEIIREHPEGTSSAAANEAIVYVDVLNEIFQKNPDIAKNFQVAYPDFQIPYMNSLAEIHQKIEKMGKDIEGMTESEDIKDIKEMTESKDIKDMEIMLEFVGLQVTWLKRRLASVQRWLESQEEARKSLEAFERANAKKREAEQELGLGPNKKQRFRFSS